VTRARILRACAYCGRPVPVGAIRCAEHAIARDNGHARRKRIARGFLATQTVCAICGQPARPNDPLTIDHVIPVAHGGQTTLANLRAAHRSCNSRRGARFTRTG
jgi:5-methylcytosine-specific restriction endonuclease McrA